MVQVAAVWLGLAATSLMIQGVTAATCPAQELTKLGRLLTNPNVKACKQAANFRLVPFSGLPDDTKLAKMCAVDACRQLFRDALNLKPDDCELTIGGASINVYRFASNFENECTRVGSSKPKQKHRTKPKSPKPKPTPSPSETTASKDSMKTAL